MIRCIFVGSANPVKINATIGAASEEWPEVVVEGFDVQSGISEQPIGDVETQKGSINRAKSALELGLQKYPDLDPHDCLGVGPEGGVTETELGMFSTVWISVVDVEGVVKFANGARFYIPEFIAEKIRSGQELGPLAEKLVGEKDVRRKQGFLGIITKNFVDRTEEYQNLTKLALGLWYGRSWEAELSSQ
ncbi:MAG: inosine/xanthosine triphosphatase [Microgenomates group bacterium]